MSIASLLGLWAIGCVVVTLLMGSCGALNAAYDAREVVDRVVENSATERSNGQGNFTASESLSTVRHFPV